MHKVQTESDPNDGSGRHQSSFSSEHLALLDYESDDSSYIGKSSELASITDSDDEDEHPELADSDNEEDVPDLPVAFLSSHQRARREVRLEREEKEAIEKERNDEANRRFDQRCEEREAAAAAARDRRNRHPEAVDGGEVEKPAAVGSTGALQAQRPRLTAREAFTSSPPVPEGCDEGIKKARVRRQRRKRSTLLSARSKAPKFAMGGCPEESCGCSLPIEPNADVCARRPHDREYVSMSDFLVQSSGAKVHPDVACILEGEAIQHVLINTTTWTDVEFEVALDSGCTDNVCHSGDAPGYVIQESLGSKCGQGFLVGNGERVPNIGEVHLSLETLGEDAHRLTSTFQVAKVSRPLMSVGRLCDAGMKVEFEKNKASVIAPDGSVACVFERQGSGLYLAKLKLMHPEPPFGRQGR